MLAARGYELIGVDFSPEMLAIAAEKTLEGEGEPPIFLCQPMEKLDLYGTVDACVCLLDSVNHITQPGKLRRAFERVRLFLEPGGLFVFDVHTPEHLAGLDGGIFLDETEDAYCVWRTGLPPPASDLYLWHGHLPPGRGGLASGDGDAGRAGLFRGGIDELFAAGGLCGDPPIWQLKTSETRRQGRNGSFSRPESRRKQKSRRDIAWIILLE